MRCHYYVGGFLAVYFLCCSMVICQEKVTNVNKVRNEFISLDVRDKPFSDIIEGIIEQTGKNIIYDEEIKNILVTIKLIQVPWRKVLEVIAKEYNCLVENFDEVIKVSKPPTVTMEFDGADIRDVINQIATIANKNIVISEEIKGNVTLRLQNVPWREALDAIIKNGGYVLVQEADGRIMRVVPPEEIQAQLETAIFTLRYVRPKSPYVAKMSSIYFKEEKAKLDANNKDAIDFSKFSLLNALNTVVTPNKGKVTYDEITNTLIIVDTKPKIDKMAEIIRQVDIEPKQIFIDVKFVRTVNTDVFDFGLGAGNTGIQIQQSFGNLRTRLPFTLGSGGFEDEIAAATRDELDQGVPNDQNILDEREAADAQLVTFGTLDFTQTRLIMRLLKVDTKTKVVQAPKIITLDHHEATIFVGDTIAFPKIEIIENDNGTQSFQLEEADNSPVRTGFQLLIHPHIIPETNKVQLTVIPSNDALSGITGQAGVTVPGFNSFTIGGQTIDLPQLTSQVVVTHMILESGQTAVVGGLMSVIQTETIRKVPFLGDLPLVGYFFKEKNINKRKEDLFIFITPRIVQSAEDTQEKLKATLSNYRKEEESNYSVIWGGGKNEAKSEAKTEGQNEVKEKK